MKSVPSSPPPEEPIRVDVSHLITEDDTPVDNPFSEKQRRLLTEPLYSSWNPGMPFVAMANVGFYFALNAPPLVPDTLVAVDVQVPETLLPKEHRAYFVWLYGKALDIVVEIVSNKAGDELTRKMDGYARHGVPYYVVYDPEGHIQFPALQYFNLDLSGSSPTYRKMDKAYFPMAELGLVEWEGEYEGRVAPWIGWTDGSGELIPTGTERASAEKNRADKLAEKLRALGIDPETIS
jgi:Uma2 family endonuclease